MLINGKCHCGNITLRLQWNEEPVKILARACGCTFCSKHGAVWTSNRAAELDVIVGDETLVSRYKFGTSTAEFMVCAKCGMVPVALCEIEGRLHSVVNINTLEDVDPALLQRAATNFDAEDVESRVARRKRTWIPNVRVHEPSKR